MPHASNQGELVRWLSRVLWGGPETSHFSVPHSLSPVIEALDLLPWDSVNDTDTDTPLAGRTATITVPDGQLWLLHHMMARNENTAVRVQLLYTNERNGFGIRVADETEDVAGRNIVWQAPVPVPIRPGGTLQAIFGGGVLGDDTILRASIQRLFL